MIADASHEQAWPITSRALQGSRAPAGPERTIGKQRAKVAAERQAKVAAERQVRVAAERQVRVAAERQGHYAEHVAVMRLLLGGYRILARRCRMVAGEIDIVAVRGRRLAFVEVKQRATWAEAAAAVRPRQTARLHRAADQWVAARPYYEGHERGFDSILVVPWCWPQVRRDALQPV